MFSGPLSLFIPAPFVFPAEVIARGKSVLDATRVDGAGYHPCVIRCQSRAQADAVAHWINAAQAAIPLPARATPDAIRARGAE